MLETSTRMSTVIPDRLWSELTEALILLIFDAAYILVAIFMIYKLWKLNRVKQPMTPSGQSGTNKSFLLFKKSLFASDCMIMWVYAFIKAIWLLQFEWKYGSVMCKLYRFTSSVAFFSNSNIVCGIALDRYLSVYSNHIIGVRQHERTKRLLYLVWIIAIIAALPQLIVWETYRPSSEDWEQCVTVFAIEIHELPAESARRDKFNFYSMLYEAYHQCMAFWLPLSITFCSYARMMSRLIPFWPFSALNSYEDERQETLCTIFWGKITDRIRTFVCVTIFRRKSHASQQSASVPLAGTTRHPPTTALRRQLGTTVFKNACAIIFVHVVLWLPYNILSLSRFVNEGFYESISQNGGNLFELLILLNSFINPILYSGGSNTVHRV
ncbi:hypothetical protein L5515_016973 [Caenorhabditis briggsae]|uniref:G-protein coupled receptors family 1 profile domain-containing protein n=1 Tax=Caenorhabditis briggsae TaxID=6238 RepID=A0AAE9FC53_CAEBR|nr:hypothetical protein L5515_016973 [Caenorhabditis briggsae]